LEDQRRFDIEAVPNLVTHALRNPDAGEQRAALQALTFAGTPGAKAGLVEIARISRSPRLAKLAASLAEKIP
jgi:hypothetical protein